jgi:recombination protein RecT
MPEAAAVATTDRPNPLVTFRQQLDQRTPEFKAALPPQIPPERFKRVALTAVQVNPDLVTAERRSFWNALMRCAADGLVPDGRQAVIVAFKGVAQYMPMIAGLLARFRNSGQFKAVTCNVVREGESFRHWIDEAGEHLMHEPGEDESARIIKAYAMAITRDGGTAIRVMSTAAIDKRRAVSRAKDGPMWREWYAEAAQKTVLRNLMKLLPSSSDDIDRIIARDEAADFDSPTAIEPPTAERERAGGIASMLDQFGGTDPAAEANAETIEGSDAPDPSTGNPPTQPPPDQSPAEPPTVAVARAMGRKARAEGVQRRAVPPEYRDEQHKAEADAWRDGWDHPLLGDPT